MDVVAGNRAWRAIIVFPVQAVCREQGWTGSADEGSPLPAVRAARSALRSARHTTCPTTLARSGPALRSRLVPTPSRGELVRDNGCFPCANGLVVAVAGCLAGRESNRFLRVGAVRLRGRSDRGTTWRRAPCSGAG